MSCENECFAVATFISTVSYCVNHGWIWQLLLFFITLFVEIDDEFSDHTIIGNRVDLTTVARQIPRIHH